MLRFALFEIFEKEPNFLKTFQNEKKRKAPDVWTLRREICGGRWKERWDNEVNDLKKGYTTWKLWQFRFRIVTYLFPYRSIWAYYAYLSFILFCKTFIEANEAWKDRNHEIVKKQTSKMRIRKKFSRASNIFDILIKTIFKSIENL